MEGVYGKRTEKVRATVMAPLNLDMLIAYSDDIYNAGPVQFLTNFDVYAMYGLVAVPATGDVVLAFGMHHSAYLVRAAQVAHADYLLGTYRPGALCRQLLDEWVPIRSGTSRNRGRRWNDQ